MPLHASVKCVERPKDENGELSGHPARSDKGGIVPMASTIREMSGLTQTMAMVSSIKMFPRASRIVVHKTLLVSLVLLLLLRVRRCRLRPHALHVPIVYRPIPHQPVGSARHDRMATIRIRLVRYRARPVPRAAASWRSSCKTAKPGCCGGRHGTKRCISDRLPSTRDRR